MEEPRKPRLTWRRIILAIFIILLVLVARPVTFLLRTYYNDPVHQTNTRAGFVNDASNLNESKVDSVVNIAEDTAQAIPQLAQLVKQAALTHKKISIA